MYAKHLNNINTHFKNKFKQISFKKILKISLTDSYTSGIPGIAASRTIGTGWWKEASRRCGITTVISLNTTILYIHSTDSSSF